MDDMETKLNAILGDPQMMSKIMAMAQNLSQSQPEAPPQEPSAPAIDLKLIQKLSGFAKQSGIDQNQQSLLKALGPYLSGQRISKLEKAMRAAKMANMASAFLGSNALLGR